MAIARCSRVALIAHVHWEETRFRITFCIANLIADSIWLCFTGSSAKYCNI